MHRTNRIIFIDEETKSAKQMDGHSGIAWLLIIAGVVIAAVGVIWLLAPSIPWLGRLPGDIVVEKENFRFYFPVVTCLILSAVLTLAISLIRWLLP